MIFCEEKIDIPGFTLACKVWNPKNFKRVLCLHGKLDNAASFDLLAPFLSNVQLVAVDYPGTGYSKSIPARCYSLLEKRCFFTASFNKSVRME